MGHIRLGRLPKTRGWKQVIELLDSSDSSSEEIAVATAKAAKEFLSQENTEAALVFPYWLLTQITSKARSDDFVAGLAGIDLDISGVNSAMGFLSSVTDFTHKGIRSRGAIFPLSEFAQLSLREVLTETIGQESRSLFGTTLEDIRLACRKYSTPRQFAILSRLYFTKVLNRSLQFFVSKESSNSVGHGRKFENISELSDFNNALEAYCYQSAKIIEDFAAGWYSKKNWQGGISERDAKGFVFVAVDKIRSEIAREEQTQEAGK